MYFDTKSYLKSTRNRNDTAQQALHHQARYIVWNTTQTKGRIGVRHVLLYIYIVNIEKSNCKHEQEIISIYLLD